jgi:hypothetical protein
VIVLKHKITGRLFLENPKILGNPNLEPASPQESEEFLSKLKRPQLDALERKRKESATKPADDFDWNVDVKFMDETKLREVAARLGLDLPHNIKVKALKELVSKTIAELKPIQNESDSVLKA